MIVYDTRFGHALKWDGVALRRPAVDDPEYTQFATEGEADAAIHASILHYTSRGIEDGTAYYSYTDPRAARKAARKAKK